MGLHEDQRFVGVRLDEGRDERLEPLADQFRRRVRKGVEEKGVGVGFGEQPCEFGLEFAVAAVPQIDELDACHAAHARRIGHARTAGRGSVGDARPEDDDAVFVGRCERCDNGVVVHADFQRQEFAPRRQVEHALPGLPVHVLDDGAGVPVFQSGACCAGHRPDPVPADVEVHAALHDRGHVPAVAARGRGPAGLDGAAVGGEEHGHAGRIAAIAADGGVVEMVTGRIDPVVGVSLHRAGAADEGQRRGIDVFAGCGGVQAKHSGGDQCEVFYHGGFS